MQISRLIVIFDWTGEKGILHENLEMAICDRRITVPRGFSTDFASIPRIFRSFIPQLGRYTAPAVAHDYMYTVGESRGYTRKEADNLFRCLMEDAGVNWLTRNLIYTALRVGGGVAWNNHQLRRSMENL